MTPKMTGLKDNVKPAFITREIIDARPIPNESPTQYWAM
jgi:hypothetical protein